jgi:hypothetical protein
MRYYDIVDWLLDLWQSQPAFDAAGINMVVSVHKLTSDSFDRSSCEDLQLPGVSHIAP